MKSISRAAKIHLLSAWAIMASIACVSQEMQNAQEICQKRDQSPVQCAAQNFKEGVGMEDSGYYGSAKSAFRIAINLDPEGKNTWRYYAELCAVNYPLGRRAIKHGKQFQWDDLHREVGYDRWLEEALAECDAAVAWAKDEYPDALAARGSLRLLAENKSGACEDFRKAKSIGGGEEPRIYTHDLVTACGSPTYFAFGPPQALRVDRDHLQIILPTSFASTGGIPAEVRKFYRGKKEETAYNIRFSPIENPKVADPYLRFNLLLQLDDRSSCTVTPIRFYKLCGEVSGADVQTDELACVDLDVQKVLQDPLLVRFVQEAGQDCVAANKRQAGRIRGGIASFDGVRGARHVALHLGR
jgi:hypothetical protein